MTYRFPSLASLLLATTLHAQTPASSLWVTLGDSDQLVEMDPYTFREIRRITVETHPHGLAISPDGSRVYTASEKTGHFQVIDARSGKTIAMIPLGNDPNQLTLSTDGRYAFVPMRGESKIAVVQLDPLKLLTKLPAPAGPRARATSPPRAPLSKLRSVVGVDLASGKVTRTVELGTLPEGVPPP